MLIGILSIAAQTPFETEIGNIIVDNLIVFFKWAHIREAKYHIQSSGAPDSLPR